MLTKVLESLVSSQLTEFLESNKLLSDAQSGFRSNHCTQDVLLKCTDDWNIIALDKGKVVGSVMIDLSKAFDSVTPSFERSLKSPEYVTLHYSHLVQQLSNWTETEDFYPQCLFRVDKLPLVFHKVHSWGPSCS